MALWACRGRLCRVAFNVFPDKAGPILPRPFRFAHLTKGNVAILPAKGPPRAKITSL
jgi:hypothetical protein